MPPFEGVDEWEDPESWFDPVPDWPGPLPPAEPEPEYPKPIYPGPVVPVVPVVIKPEVIPVVKSNGVAILPYFGPAEQPATPAGFPVIAGGVGISVVALGALKSLLAKFGPTIVKSIIGAAAFKTLMDLIFGGASDDTPVKVSTRKRSKRYSIGTNPRINTLLKVGKRVDNIFANYDQRIRKFRSRLRGYSPPRRHTYAPSPRYLSAVERKQIRGR